MYNKFTFQFRAKSAAAWETIDDSDFMDRLYRHHDKLTPIIKVMLNGTVLLYMEGQYRIVPKGNLL